MSEKRTLRYSLDARPKYNDLFLRVRDRDADLYRRVTECVAGELLSQVKYVVARVEGRYDAVFVQLTPPDGMAGRELGLLEAVRAAASRDPELLKSQLGRGARLQLVRSGPAPEPEPEPPPAVPAVAAVTPAEAGSDAGRVTLAFNPLGDLRTQLLAIAWWPSIKQQLAQYRAAHPELGGEPDITVPAPPGVDADLLLEAIARAAAADPAPLGASLIRLRVAPAVA